MPLIRRTPDAPKAEPAQRLDPTDGLRSPVAEERWEAARSFAGKPDAVAVLAKALTIETDPRVREAVFTSLAITGTAASVEAVLPYLRSDDASARTNAIDALRAMPVAMAARLPGLLADPDSDVRLLACDLARELPGAEATSLLSGLLERDREVNVCAAAVDVLAERGTLDALPALRQCAARFAGEAFLLFAIDIAMRRIGSERSSS